MKIQKPDFRWKIVIDIWRIEQGSRNDRYSMENLFSEIHPNSFSFHLGGLICMDNAQFFILGLDVLAESRHPVYPNPYTFITLSEFMCLLMSPDFWDTLSIQIHIFI